VQSSIKLKFFRATVYTKKQEIPEILLKAFPFPCSADGIEAFKKGVVGFVPRLCDMVIQDPEHQVPVP
jgi:hypothetical protein